MKKNIEPTIFFNQWPKANIFSPWERGFSLFAQHIYESCSKNEQTYNKVTTACKVSSHMAKRVNASFSEKYVVLTLKQIDLFIHRNFSKSFLQDVCFYIAGERPHIKDQIGKWISCKPSFVLSKHKLGKNSCLGSRFFIVNMAYITFTKHLNTLQLTTIKTILKKYFFQTQFTIIYIKYSAFILNKSALSKNTFLKKSNYTRG